MDRTRVARAPTNARLARCGQEAKGLGQRGRGCLTARKRLHMGAPTMAKRTTGEGRGGRRGGAGPTGKAARGTLPLAPPKSGHGGARPGAGRKPKHGVARVDHRQRGALASRFPVHVTIKLLPGLPPLRRKAEYAVLRAAFCHGGKGGKDGRSPATEGAFRLCHYAILNDHLHLIVEARDRHALTRGLQGLMIRVARGLNRLWNRQGKVFADRHHDRILKTPKETRNALRYVLHNGRKHAAEGREVVVPQAIDVFTSAPWFDGYREPFVVRGLDGVETPVERPRTWLLSKGWRRHGLLSMNELPQTS